MKFSSLSLIILSFVIITFAASDAEAQSRKTPAARSAKTVAKPGLIGSRGVVIDERLSVLRFTPSLYGESIQRMRRGREVIITGTKQSDGVTFFKVNALPDYAGWVQSDAIYGTFRDGDDERFAKLVFAVDGFEKVDLSVKFLGMYKTSVFRPAIMLLLGDVLEETALTLTKTANKQLTRSELAASGAPVHSYFLNFNMLDRYRKLGILYLFNVATRKYHYNGQCWKDLVKNYPDSNEAEQARARLASLDQKMNDGTAQLNFDAIDAAIPALLTSNAMFAARVLPAVASDIADNR